MAQQMQTPPSPEQSQVRRDDYATQQLGVIREQLGAAKHAWESGDRSEFVREDGEIAKTAIRTLVQVASEGFDAKPGSSQSAQQALQEVTQQLQQSLQTAQGYSSQQQRR